MSPSNHNNIPTLISFLSLPLAFKFFGCDHLGYQAFATDSEESDDDSDVLSTWSTWEIPTSPIVRSNPKEPEPVPWEFSDAKKVLFQDICAHRIDNLSAFEVYYDELRHFLYKPYPFERFEKNLSNLRIRVHCTLDPSIPIRSKSKHKNSIRRLIANYDCVPCLPEVLPTSDDSSK